MSRDKDINIWKVPMMQPEKEKHKCSTETLTHRNFSKDSYVCLCGKEWDGPYVAMVIKHGNKRLVGYESMD